MYSAVLKYTHNEKNMQIQRMQSQEHFAKFFCLFGWSDRS